MTDNDEGAPKMVRWLRSLSWRLTGNPLPTSTTSADGSSHHAQACAGDDYADTSTDDLETAAMRALWPLPMASSIFPPSVEEIDRIDARRISQQAWLDAQPFRGRLRRAYQKWIDHCERENAEARTERIHGHKRKAHEATMRKWAEQSTRVSAIRLPKP